MAISIDLQFGHGGDAVENKDKELKKELTRT